MDFKIIDSKADAMKNIIRALGSGEEKSIHFSLDNHSVIIYEENGNLFCEYNNRNPLPQSIYPTCSIQSKKLIHAKMAQAVDFLFSYKDLFNKWVRGTM